MKLKIVTVWLAILLLGSMLYSMLTVFGPVSMTALPEVPKKDKPVLVTYKLNNPSSQPATTDYSFYTNGQLLKSGSTLLGPGETKTYQYLYDSPVEIGKQVTFLLKTNFNGDSREETVTVPAYPPQIMSSFISFASFSTSVMTSMSTMTYYESSFTFRKVITTSSIIAIVLIFVLAYLELTHHRFARAGYGVLGSLRIRFNLLSWILFAIFGGIILTDVVLILSA